MPKMDLEVHLEFLNQLEQAIEEAMDRYQEAPDIDLAEICEIHSSVLQAKAFIANEIEKVTAACLAEDALGKAGRSGEAASV